MPRYHFNVYDHRNITDDVGTDLPDAAAAQREAVRYSGGLLLHDADHLGPGDDWRMEVTDNTGLILFSLNFAVVAEAATLGNPPLRKNGADEQITT